MLATLRSEPIREASRAAVAERSWLLLALLVLGPLGALYFAARWPLIPLDEAMVYVTSAQSLAEGQGYRLIGYLCQPPNTFTPPGYSLALAAIFKLQPDFPANLPLLQLASLLLFYALLALGALVLRRHCHASPTETTLAILLAATTPLALKLSTALLSDTLYGVLALGSILLVGAGWRRRGVQGGMLVLAGALLGACAYNTRTAGITLVVALAGYALRHRQGGRWRAGLLLLPVALVVPWTAWSGLSGGSGNQDYWVKGLPGWHIGINSPQNLLLVVSDNFVRGAEILWVVAPALVDADLVSGILFAFVLWQSWRAWWRTGELVHLYLLLYLLMTLLLPWRVVGRYVWPVAPLLAWYPVVALRQGWSLLSARFHGQHVPVGGLLVGLLLVINGIGLAGVATRLVTSGWAFGPAYRDEMVALDRTAAYLRQLEPTDGVLGSNHWGVASWWYLYTGRRGVDAIARTDGAPPYWVRRASQGDPEAVTYFVYHRANGMPFVNTDDLPLVLATLAARGTSTEPLYCAEDHSLCVFDWRPGGAAGSTGTAARPPLPEQLGQAELAGGASAQGR